MFETFSIIGILIVGALLLLWAWNSMADGLFQLPAMGFKQELAVELFLLLVFLIPGTVSKFLMRGSHPLYTSGGL